MLKTFIPFAHAKTIYDIDFVFFKKIGIKYIISDLDNTLDAFDTFTPGEEALNFKRKCDENGIKLILISNNHSKRVTDYARDLNVVCLSSACKPFKRRLLKFIKNLDINKDNVIIIGDQTVTDIACGNRAKIKTILTDKFVERDQPTTKFNRFFDKRIRRRLAKKKKLKDWREIYEQY